MAAKQLESKCIRRALERGANILADAVKVVAPGLKGRAVVLEKKFGLPRSSTTA